MSLKKELIDKQAPRFGHPNVAWEVPRAGRELAKSSHAPRPCALTVIRGGVTHLEAR